MTDSRQRDLCELLERGGLAWLVRDADSAPHQMERVMEAEKEYEARFGGRVDLLAACKAIPDKMRAWPQALAAGVCPGLLAMVARVLLHDAWVVHVRFEFESRKSVRLEIAIEDREAGVQRFESTEIWDAEVLRHFGLMKVGEKPIIDGYYAFRTA